MEKLAREFFKLNYLSYDTLFVKIGAVLFYKATRFELDTQKGW